MQGAILQLNVTDDPVDNLEVTRELLAQAVAEGAEFVLTPEVTNCISTSGRHQRDVLQNDWEKRRAARRKHCIVYSSIALLLRQQKFLGGQNFISMRKIL